MRPPHRDGGERVLAEVETLLNDEGAYLRIGPGGKPFRGRARRRAIVGLLAGEEPPDFEAPREA